MPRSAFFLVALVLNERGFQNRTALANFDRQEPIAIDQPKYNIGF